MRYRIGENPTLTAYGTTGDFIVLSAVIGLVEARGGRSCSGGSFAFLITTQAKRNLSSRSGIGGVVSAT